MTTNHAPTVREILNIESFFKAIGYKLGGYPLKTFSYIATKCGSEFFLLPGPGVFKHRHASEPHSL
jgi:hypothetical protein